MTTLEIRPEAPAEYEQANEQAAADKFRWSTLLVVLTGTFMTTLDSITCVST